MARIGRLQVSCDFNDGSDLYVSTYRMTEIEIEGVMLVGLSNDEGSQYSVTWYDDVDLSVQTDIDGMFRFGGTNTYTWLTPMTEVPDEEVEVPPHTHDYAAINHVHTEYAAIDHTHTIANITNLQSMLDGKAATGHSHGNTVLWSGGSYMGSSHIANLSQKISEQDHGIAIVFSGYDTSKNTPLNNSWTTHFVPKEMIQYNNGGGQTFLMAINSGMSDFGSKYLYIEDDKIMGHVSNTQAGTGASGITFSNNKYVMRYVIGF